MKICYYLFASLLLLNLASSLQAQEATDVAAKEISEPPYVVGDLANEAGYYLDLEAGERMNFRMVGTKIRVYWIDAEGLVMEPKGSSGNVRFNKTQSGRKFYQLAPIAGEAGLGSPEVIRFPHTFNLVLNVKDGETGQVATYPFRYIQTMSAVRSSAE